MDIILEIKSCETVRLQTRLSGDVEVISSLTTGDSYHGKNLFPGGVIDTCIGIIPKSKRAEIAQFLVSA